MGGATVQDLHHYILPSIVKDYKPDIVAIHIRSNSIRDIRKVCKGQDIRDILSSSILVKQIIKLGIIIAQVQ